MYTLVVCAISTSVNWIGIAFAYNLYELSICGMFPEVLKLLFSLAVTEVVGLNYCIFCTKIEVAKRVGQGNFEKEQVLTAADQQYVWVNQC